MKCLTFFKERSLSLANPSILPGVPTTIFGHSFLIDPCELLILMPSLKKKKKTNLKISQVGSEPLKLMTYLHERHCTNIVNQKLIE